METTGVSRREAFAWSQAQRDGVRAVEFREARRGDRGYDETAVDRLLDDVVAAMEQARPMPCLAVTFEPPSHFFRRGYDADQVDAYLRQLALSVPES